MNDDVAWPLLAVPLIGFATAVRWPRLGLMLYLWLDFMRPHDYLVELRPLRPMLALAVGLLLAAALALRREDLRASLRPLLPLGLLLVAVTPGALAGDRPDAAALLTPLKLGLVSWLMMTLLRSRSAFDQALLVIGCSLAVLAADALWQAYRSGLHVQFDVAKVVEGPGRGGEGVFRDNNDLARALTFGVALWSAFVGRSAVGWPGAMGVLGSVAVVAGIVATGSRGGFVALVCTCAWLFFSRLRPFNALITTVALVVFLVGLAMPRSYVERISEVASPAAAVSVQSRVEIWTKGLATAVERPLFGHGLGTFAVPHAKGPEYPPRTAHSIYVELLYEAGAIGLAAYLLLLAVTARSLWRIAKDKVRDPWIFGRAVALQAALVSFLVASVSLGSAFQSIPFVVVGLSLALADIARPS